MTMAIAYVLILAAPMKEHELYENLLQISEITELYPLFGDYDFIAKLVTDNYDKLGKIVVDCIRTIDGEIETKTLTGVEF